MAAFKSLRRSRGAFDGLRSRDARWRGTGVSDERVVPAARSERPPQPQVLVDVEALVAAAREQGRAEAEAAHATEADALSEMARVLRSAVDAAERARRESVHQAAQDIADIVLRVSRRVVEQSLALHPDALPQLIREAIAQLPESDEFTIAVAPTMIDQISRTMGSDLGRRVVADPDIINGCVVRTRHVSIESTVDTVLVGVDAAIRAWLSEQAWVSEWVLTEPEESP